MTQGATLTDLITAALRDGWALTTDLAWADGQIERTVRMFGYSLVPNRGREFKIEVLTPTDKADAHPNSLSAQYGTGPQPLHTDGAHHEEPPEVILLAASAPSAVPTLLWSFPAAGERPKEIEHDLREGLFTVRSGRSAFLAHAIDGLYDTKVRYDPGCMSPADGRARRVAAFIGESEEDAALFEWNAPGTVLAINNRKVLHARGDATDEPERQVERLALRVTKALK